MAQPAGGTPEQFLERKRKANAKGSSMGVCLSDLNMVAQMAGWVTPQASDIGEPNGGRFKKDRETRDPSLSGNYRMDLHDQVGMLEGISTSGETTESSAAGTVSTGESRASLNPAFCQWLMGYHRAWIACGIAAKIRSSRRPKKPKKRSVRTRSRDKKFPAKPN